MGLGAAVSYILRTGSADETIAIGKALGEHLDPGTIVALDGDLGAGKTQLTKGIAAGMGVQAPVDSPAFDLIHEYPGNPPLYHLDLYRIERLSEEDLLWLEEYLEGDSVVVIEWASRMPAMRAAPTLRIAIAITGEDERELAIELAPTAPQRLQHQLKRLCSPSP